MIGSINHYQEHPRMTLGELRQSIRQAMGIDSSTSRWTTRELGSYVNDALRYSMGPQYPTLAGYGRSFTVRKRNRRRTRKGIIEEDR